jgi:transcription initiation factor IIE alpha subunit
MSKICPECKEKINYVDVSFRRENLVSYYAQQDDDGVDFENESEGDVIDYGDSQDFGYNCPECGAEIDEWDDLHDDDDADDDERVARKKKEENELILNGLIKN